MQCMYNTSYKTFGTITQTSYLLHVTYGNARKALPENTKIPTFFMKNSFGPHILAYYCIEVWYTCCRAKIAAVVPIQRREEHAKKDNPSTTYLVI